MTCLNCGNKKMRKVTIGTITKIHYLQCTNCERVVFEAPDHIPLEQKERYLRRIKKGKGND